MKHFRSHDEPDENDVVFIASISSGMPLATFTVNDEGVEHLNIDRGNMPLVTLFSNGDIAVWDGDEYEASMRYVAGPSFDPVDEKRIAAARSELIKSDWARR